MNRLINYKNTSQTLVRNVNKVNIKHKEFSSLSIKYEQNKADVQDKAPKLDPKVDQWLRENKDNFAINEENPKDFKPVQYLGRNNTPFPLNPFFKPHKPVSEEIKKKIFEFYKQNPKVNTPRKLGATFKLSIRRVEAILKLKSLQEELVNKGKDKFVLQTNFQVGMEKLLGVTNMYDREDLEPILPKVGKPLFIAIDEEIEFGPKDAAKALNRKSFEETTKELIKDVPFEYHGLRGDRTPEMNTPLKVISKDEQGTHRKFQFMFTDINPNLNLKDRKVLIREKNGTLREATLFEKKFRARHNDWPNQSWIFKPTPAEKYAEKATK